MPDLTRYFRAIYRDMLALMAGRMMAHARRIVESRRHRLALFWTQAGPAIYWNKCDVCGRGARVALFEFQHLSGSAVIHDCDGGALPDLNDPSRETG